jgi:hypothetical protein
LENCHFGGIEELAAVALSAEIPVVQCRPSKSEKQMNICFVFLFLLFGFVSKDFVDEYVVFSFYLSQQRVVIFFLIAFQIFLSGSNTSPPLGCF